MDNRVKRQIKVKRPRNGTHPQSTKFAKDITIQAIVVDSGAYSIKIGATTDVQPTIIPNCIMKAKSERKRFFIGDQISECRDLSGLFYLMPTERGYITKWDVQKPIWDYVFSKSHYPVTDKNLILTQPLFNFKSVQDCLDEIFFEEYDVMAMCRLLPADMAKLKYNQDNGQLPECATLVVDTGYSYTHVIPYVKGQKYLSGIRRLNIGGKLLTNHLKDLISYRQYNVMEETYVINQVKEDTCYVAEDVRSELRLAAKNHSKNTIVKNYVLPDFNNIRRGYIQDPDIVDEKAENCQILRLNNERFVVPELIFNPSDVGMRCKGLSETIIESIFACPESARQDLARNIILIGGNCNFRGFKDRVFAEVRSRLPDIWELKVFQPKDPISYAWSGNNALLRHPQLNSFLVTKQFYEENGSAIVQERYNNWMSDKEIPVFNVDSDMDRPAASSNYLSKITGRSIFGKQDPVLVKPVKENGIVDVEGTDDKEEALPFPVTAEDELVPTQVSQPAEGEQEPNPVGEQAQDEACSMQEPEWEEFNTNELFPFGMDKYL